MGNRYILEVSCPYCKYKEDDFWYAPTCGADSFTCPSCHKTSFVVAMDLKKAEEVTAKELTEGELSNLNMWSPNEKEQQDMLDRNKERLISILKNNKIVLITE